MNWVHTQSKQQSSNSKCHENQVLCLKWSKFKHIFRFRLLHLKHYQYTIELHTLRTRKDIKYIQEIGSFAAAVLCDVIWLVATLVNHVHRLSDEGQPPEDEPCLPWNNVEICCLHRNFECAGETPRRCNDL